MATNIVGATGIDKVQDGIIVNADIDTVAASKLTGALPAISGASLTNIPAANITGTLPALAATNLTAIPAANITGTLPAISGASLTSVRDTTGGRRNMVINGDMQISQRGTSFTGLNTDSSAFEAYYLDRFLFGGDDAGIWTVTQDSESPVGFGSSMKMDCTTAKASLDANSYAYVLHKIERFNCQQLAFGGSSAKALTLSFWVRSPKTGTHFAEFYHGDSSGSSKRKSSHSYTVSTANTWEKKTITWAAGTGLRAITNNNGWGLMIIFYLVAGSNLTSGTHTGGAWHNTEANRTPGQVNCADSTSNNFYLTGVQLEVGSTATDFEHKTYGEELALCRRYYQAHHLTQHVPLCIDWMGGSNSGNMRGSFNFDVTMRVAPTQGFLGSGTWYNQSNNAGAPDSMWFTPNMMIAYNDEGLNILGNSADDAITFSAEL